MIKGVPPDPGEVVPAVDSDRPRPRIDALSRRIITMLQLDGRRSAASMARELVLPEHVVEKRVRDLLDTGVVLVAAVSDPVRLGFEGQAMLGIATEPGQARVVAEDLAARDEFVYILLTAGSFDVMAELYGEDEAHVNAVIAELESLPGIRSVQIYLYAGLEKLIYTWDLHQ